MVPPDPRSKRRPDGQYPAAVWRKEEGGEKKEKEGGSSDTVIEAAEPVYRSRHVDPEHPKKGKKRGRGERFG